ncbi:MAG: transcriptional repressor [Nitrospina sp.]|jgi:Fur family transcriptional regulator, ferric uptake regulator|nr:transcriptional repressor [Nitrospina sp.]
MLNEFDLFKDFLRQQKLRWTPQRKMILEVFLSFEGHVQIEVLHEKIRAYHPDVGIATLYRTLKLLTDCGLVEAHSFQNGKKTYERMFHVRHHDHLICTRCEETIEFEHPLIEKYQLEICEQFGFTLKSHKMELFGICKRCQKPSCSS